MMPINSGSSRWLWSRSVASQRPRSRYWHAQADAEVSMKNRVCRTSSSVVRRLRVCHSAHGRGDETTVAPGVLLVGLFRISLAWPILPGSRCISRPFVPPTPGWPIHQAFDPRLKDGPHVGLDESDRDGITGAVVMVPRKVPSAGMREQRTVRFFLCPFVRVDLPLLRLGAHPGSSAGPRFINVCSEHGVLFSKRRHLPNRFSCGHVFVQLEFRQVMTVVMH